MINLTEKVPISGEIPQARFGHTITQINKNLVVLFGGATGDTGKYSITGDVFACDLSLRRWKKLNPSGIGPTNRAAHCSAPIDNANKLIIFGGAVGGGGLADDNLYVLDLSQGEEKAAWMSIPIVGSTPGRRYGHSMAYIKPYIVVFGGNTGSEPVNDAWALDIEKSPFGWKKLECTGELPLARVYHSAALCTSGAANGMMVIFGGRTNDQYAQNDSWGLRRHRDGRWDWVRAPYKNSAEPPLQRYQHSTVFQGPLMFVVGGRSNQMNDQIHLEVYDTETSDWHKFNGVQRFRHSIWIMENYLYVHGGFDTEQPNIPTDSILRLDLLKVLQTNQNLVKQFMKQPDKFSERAGTPTETNKPSTPDPRGAQQTQQQQLQQQQQQQRRGMEIEEINKPQQQVGGGYIQQNQAFNQYVNKPAMQQIQQQPQKQIRLTDAVVAITYDNNVAQDTSIKKVPVNKLSKQCIKLNPQQRNQENAGQPRKIYLEQLFSPFLDQLLQPEQYENMGMKDQRDLVSQQLRKDMILKLCDEVQKVFEREPMVLRVRTPIKIFGNINGQYEDLMRFFNHFGAPCDSEMIDEDIDSNEYLFLGNYIGRGSMQLEVILLLFALKLKYFDQIHLLRGNMEDRRMNKAMGFADECAKKFNEDINDPNSIFQRLNKVFEYMPLAAVVEDSILCLHGGIGTTLRTIEEIEQIPRPLEIIQDPKTYQHKVALEILWSDPAINENQNDNSENLEHDIFNLKNVLRFGQNRVNKFMQENNVSMIIRSHEPVLGGIQKTQSNVITIFSNSNYCGRYMNAAAILCIGKYRKIQPKTIQPIINVNTKSLWLDLETSFDQRRQGAKNNYQVDQEEMLLRKRKPTPPRDDNSYSN